MSSGLQWAALTIGCWGLYGILLHQGSVAMGDPANGRLKAFLFVGVAYFLTAVLAPLALLAARGAGWDFPGAGMGWALLAGTVGAIGAFGVLLAFGAGARPAVVMTLVFAGAPVVNALVATTLAGSWGQVRWPFLLGIALAVTGGALVTTYKPAPPPASSGH
jgi:hypothetical protein